MVNARSIEFSPLNRSDIGQVFMFSSFGNISFFIITLFCLVATLVNYIEQLPEKYVVTLHV